MARYIDLSDKAKAACQLREARKFDHAGTLAEITARAAAINASDASNRAKERRLKSLRIEYASALRYQHFAATGVNSAHVGLAG